MTKHTPLTRTCTACGIEKPLSAFLYLTSKGTTYGTICSTCRGKGITEQKPSVAPEDDRSRTTSGMRIGVKQLLEIELQKKQDREDRQIRQEQDIKKREQVSLEKSESTETKEKAEKFHRETYIDEKKKQGFLNYQTIKNPFSAQSVIGQKQTEPFKAPVLDEKQRALEASKLAEAIQLEERKTTVDLSGSPVIEEQHHHITREATLKRLESVLSGDAPILKNKSQLYKTSFVSQKSDGTDNSNKETPVEFIEKTWGPSSRKR